VLRPRAAAAPALQQSIDISYPSGPQQQTRRMLLQRKNGTDGRTPCHYTSPALHTMRRAVLFCSLAVLHPRVGHTMDVLPPFICVPVILTDSSTGSPAHVLMLSIQAVRGLHRLRAPGIVPCIISFSRSMRGTVPVKCLSACMCNSL